MLKKTKCRSLISMCKHVNGQYVHYREEGSFVFIDENRYVICEIHFGSAGDATLFEHELGELGLSAHPKYSQIKWESVRDLIDGKKQRKASKQQWRVNPSSLKMVNDVFRALGVFYTYEQKGGLAFFDGEYGDIHLKACMTLARY